MKRYLYLLVILMMFSSAASMFPENHIRIVKMDYKDSWLGITREASNGIEILSGKSELNLVVIFQNVSGNELQFRVGAEITNKLSGKVIYHQNVIVSGEELSNPYSGVIYVDENGDELEYPTSQYSEGLPPGGYIKVIFLGFDPKNYKDDEIGELLANAYSMNRSYPDGQEFEGEDTKDDSLKYNMYVLNIKNTLDLNGFPQNWICKGIDIIDGNDECYMPYSLTTRKYYPDSSYDMEKAYTRVIKMNRTGINGEDIQAGSRGGDTLISGIIDCRERFGEVFSLEYERTGKTVNSYDRGWSDTTLTGPEQLVISENTGKTLTEPDKLVVEFIWDKDYSKLLNPPDSLWTTLPVSGYGPNVHNSPLTIFGGGGYARGYLEENHDSAVSYENGIRPDPDDAGKDFDFRMSSITLPDTCIIDAGYMRFRIRVEAADNTGPSVSDDDDNFYIRDIHTMFPSATDLSTVSVNANNPYSTIPMNSTVKIPLFFKIRNKSLVPAPEFYSIIRIRHESEMPWSDKPDHSERYIDTVRMPMLRSNSTVEVVFPTFDLAMYSDLLKPGINKFYVLGSLYVPGGDFVAYNDTILTEFTVNMGESFAYDNPANVVNDVAEFSGIDERGLNLPAYSSGIGAPDHAFGETNPTGGGKIAVRFELSERDTVFGFQSFFANLGQSQEPVQYEIYRDNDGLPGEKADNTTLPGNKGYDDIRNDYYFDEYATSLYQQPVILDSGVYWVAVTQMGDVPLGLGGSAYRAGMITTVYDEAGEGANDRCINISRGMQQPIYDTTEYYIKISSRKNANYFAYTNSINGSENWVPFTPDKGNPAYAHLGHAGTIDGTETYSRGTFIPMLRVYMGGDYKTGVRQTEMSGGITVFPNPLNDLGLININNIFSGGTAVEIYDLMGNKVLGRHIDPGEKSIYFDVSGLSSGIYMLVLRAGNKTIERKISVIH